MLERYNKKGFDRSQTSLSYRSKQTIGLHLFLFAHFGGGIPGAIFHVLSCEEAKEGSNERSASFRPILNGLGGQALSQHALNSAALMNVAQTEYLAISANPANSSKGALFRVFHWGRYLNIDF